MRSKSYRSLIVTLLAAVVAATNFGCGGSSASPPPPPPPPNSPSGISVGLGSSTGSTAVNLPGGGTVQFTAVVSNDPANKGVTWNLSCSPCGSLFTDGYSERRMDDIYSPVDPPGEYSNGRCHCDFCC